jgi:Cd2+/Zn2+-exporting ATPase
MIKLVESSQSAKSRIKTLAERFASWYIGIMLIVSIVAYSITGDTRLVLAIVLVVCADDIAIAIPLAYVAAIGTAARRGIIIKSADFLEQAAKITTLIVDKTGTLTMGRLMVKNAYSWGNTPLSQVVQGCGGLCNRSTHPVAKAILRYAEENNISCGISVDVTEVEGRGIIGTNEGIKVVLGRHEFLHEQGISMNDEMERTIAEEELRGNNATLVALNGEIVGLFALADEVRAGVAETITALEKSGVKETIMLTGDNAGVAKAIAERTGIDKYYPGLLPENKVSILAKYLGRGRTVAMIGDGVNDAAVLTRSDVGIAMGGIGSDAAIDSADIVLMKDDFTKLLELRSIARKVIAIVHQNFTIWAIVNAIGLYFVFTGVFDPAHAAAYNFLTDFIPIANALRLYRYR